MRTGRHYAPHDITKENFEKFTQGSKDHVEHGEDGNTRCFGVCPACDNPVQLIGLYTELKNTDRPYGKHYNRSIKLAPHNQQNYICCPYASHSRNVTCDTRKDELTDFEKEIYYSVRENFDLAIYVLQQDSGLYIGRHFAREILEEYISRERYMYYWATQYNIPWMLGYAMIGRPLYGKTVRAGSALHTYLEGRENVRLLPARTEGHSIVSRCDGFLNLNFSFILHDRSIVNDEVKETIQLSLWTKDPGRPPVSEHMIPVTINEFRFPKLIKTAKCRNQGLLDIAKEMMPDLD